MKSFDVRQEMLSLMRRGYTVSLSLLKSLFGITDDVIALVRSKMQPEDFLDCGGIARIKSDCAKLADVDDGDIAAILTYFQVKRHLDHLNLPYIDCDDNDEVKNAKQLIIEPQLNRELEVDTLSSIHSRKQQHTAHRINWPYARSPLDEMLHIMYNNHWDSDEFVHYSSSEHEGDDSESEGDERDTDDTSDYRDAEFETVEIDRDSASSDSTMEYNYGSTEHEDDEIDDSEVIETTTPESNTASSLEPPRLLNRKRQRIVTSSDSSDNEQ